MLRLLCPALVLLERALYAARPLVAMLMALLALLALGMAPCSLQSSGWLGAWRHS